MITILGKATVPIVNQVCRQGYGGLVGMNGVDIGGIQTDKVLYLPGYPYVGTTINDRSGNGNHGTITGATWVRLPSGLWVLNFDGDDRVSCGVATSLEVGSSDFSVLVWCKVTDTVNLQVIVGKLSFGLQQFGIYANTGVISGAMRADGAGITVDMIAPYSASAYYLIALTRLTNTLTLYANGVPQNTGDVTGITPDTSAQIFRIGETYNSTYRLTGQAGLVKQLTVALSTTQIVNIFNQERHLFGV